MEKNYYPIYMPNVAAELRFMGFKLVKVTPNYRKPQYDIYWFNNTADFRNAIPVAVKRTKEWKENKK